MKLVGWALLITIVCTSVVFADAPASNPSTHATTKPIVVKKGTIHPRIDADGYFEPIDALEVRIRPEAYQGDLKVTSVAAHGARVKKADVLLSIDADSLNRQIAAASTDLTNAQAALAKAQSDIELGEQGDQLALKVQTRDLANAKDGLKWWEEVDGKQMLTGAELATRVAKAAVDDQQDELDQLKKMYKSEELTNATADIVVKRALRNLEIGKVNQTMAEEREGKTKKFDYDRERTKLVFAIDQQTNSLSQLQAAQIQSKVTRKTALDTAKASLDRAQKKADDLSKDFANFTVTAPFDGIVYYGALVSGGWQNSGPKALRMDDRIAANQIVMTFIAPGKLRVIAEIPEPRLLWAQPGAKARLTPASNPQASCEGTCGVIIPIPSTANDHGQSFAMPVEPASVDPHLAPGEKVNVQVDLPAVKDVLIVPIASVQHGRVKMKSDGDAEVWRTVVTGMSDEKNVEIKSGLSEGDVLAE